MLPDQVGRLITGVITGRSVTNYMFVFVLAVFLALKSEKPGIAT